MPTVPLQRVVDDDQWQAEDLAGRLGIVVHAAFLHAGFVPYGDEPSSGHLLKQVDEIGPSAPSLSRRYTAASLARRKGGATVDVAVLELRARGNGDVAFQAYLLPTRVGNRRCLLCEAVLDEASLAPLLCCRLADAARALETGSAGAWLWKSLTDWVFPALLHELCRWNDLPVTGFASLPDDSKVEILKKLTDGKDLARVECTSRQLQCLVTDRDSELWKAMYTSLDLLQHVQSSDSEGLSSWKQKYMNQVKNLNAWRRRRVRTRFFGWYNDDEDWFPQHRRQEVASLPRLLEYEFLRSESEGPFIVAPVESTGFTYHPYMVREHPPEPPPELELAARGKDAGRQHRKVQRNHYHKKRHGAGAIHSPSSRNRWKHR